MQQAITCTNVDYDPWRHMESLHSTSVGFILTWDLSKNQNLTEIEAIVTKCNI